MQKHNFSFSVHLKKHAILLIITLIFILFYIPFIGERILGQGDDLNAFNPADPNSIFERFWFAYTHANGRISALLFFALNNVPSQLFHLTPFQIPWHFLYTLNFVSTIISVYLLAMTLFKFLEYKHKMYPVLIGFSIFSSLLISPVTIYSYFSWFVMAHDYSFPFLTFALSFFLMTNELNTQWKKILIFCLVLHSSSSNEILLGLYAFTLFHYIFLLNLKKSILIRIREAIVPLSGILLSIVGFALSPGQRIRSATVSVDLTNFYNNFLQFIEVPTKFAKMYFTGNTDQTFVNPIFFILSIFLVFLFLFSLVRGNIFNKNIKIALFLHILSYCAAWTKLFSSYFPDRVGFFTAFFYLFSLFILFFEVIKIIDLKFKTSLFSNKIIFPLISIYILNISFHNYINSIIEISKIYSIAKTRYVLYKNIINNYESYNGKNVYFHHCPFQIDAPWGIERYKEWTGLKDKINIMIDGVNFTESTLNDNSFIKFECPQIPPRYFFQKKIGRLESFRSLISHNGEKTEINLDFPYYNEISNCRLNLQLNPLVEGSSMYREYLEANFAFSAEWGGNVIAWPHPTIISKTKGFNNLMTPESQIVDVWGQPAGIPVQEFDKKKFDLLPIYLISKDPGYFRVIIKNIPTRMPLAYLKYNMKCSTINNR